MATKPLITSRTDWTPELISEIYKHIEDIALNDMKLDVYDNQIEIISAEQMIDAYSSHGLPVNYSHWSFGKQFLRDWNKYQKGHMGLAYEIVINTQPCISYLMEENNAITQALVIAHAAFGHNHVFKNNYVFKEWTEAGSIIDYMIYAKNYIQQCEDKHGVDEVEMILDAAHAISMHGIDKHKRKDKRKKTEEQLAAEAVAKADEEQQNLDIIMKRTTVQPNDSKDGINEIEEIADEENLLYFIYTHAPNMEPWQREILQIVYRINQYFYPQIQTKVLNEGMATFTHFYIMDQLEKKGLISDDAQMAWLHLHSSVLYQPTIKNKHYDGHFNPYTLGFNILRDVKRICENPTEEDKEWFPQLIGMDWRDAVKWAVADFRDESFIEQFLSPKLMRDFNMFQVESTKNKALEVTEISDEMGYRAMRRNLAASYSMVEHFPEIIVKGARMKSDRTLLLEYRPYRNRSLYAKYAKSTMEHIKLLWGYDVELVLKPENAEKDVDQKLLFRC